MPKYLYECGECEGQFELVHGMNEIIDICELCGSKDTLFLVPDFSLRPSRNVEVVNKKVGSLVKKHIEDSKDALKREKQELKRDTY